MRLRSICPHCPRIVPARATCPCRTAAQSARRAAETWRQVYSLPSYRRNRAARYELAHGLCEACGVELRGKLHPHGAKWECDHHLEARRFTDLDAANAIENLRCYCIACHKAKPKGR